jgi:hypothetical protein
VSTVGAPTLQLLAWIAERARTYPETIDVWRSSCPRLTVWEDALADGLVRVDRGQVALTAAGADELARFGSRAPQPGTVHGHSSLRPLARPLFPGPSDGLSASRRAGPG